MFRRLSHIYQIFRQEWRMIVKDQGVALIMIGAVFLYSIFYMAPFHHHIARDISIGVIDNDHSKLSRSIVRALDSNEMIKITEYPKDLAEAKQKYYSNAIKAFVIIPKNFERDIKRGKATTAAAYLDSAYLIVYKQLTGGINEVFAATGAQLEIQTLMKKGLTKQQAVAVKNPFEFIQIPLFNPSGSYQNYIYPLVLVLVLQQTMLIGIGILAGTRYEKNFKTNKKASELMIGRAMAYTSLYIIYAFLFFVIFPNIVIYRTGRNLLVLFLFLIPFLFSTAFLGQALSFVFKTRESPFFILIASSVPFIFLSGFVWPYEAMPQGIKLLAKLIPSTSMIHGAVRLNQMGADFYQVVDDFLMLCVLCVIYYLLAFGLLKKASVRNYRSSTIKSGTSIQNL